MDNNNYPLQFVNWLDKIPFDILCLIGSSLSGYDAFSFAESVSQEIMISERKFWSILGISLTSIEMDLFRICRHGDSTEGSIVVQDLDSFINNLNNRFSFSYIKHWINFSSFVIAGGAVLNCLLIEGFDSSLQDLDVFWLGGSWKSFLNEINNFKQMAHARILTEKNYYGKLIEFQLYIDQDHITLGFFQAIATKTFICYKLTNDIRDAPLYLDRCLKYNTRGFMWLCPMFYDQNLAQKPLISAKKETENFTNAAS
ncbi:unnamed protein product [Rotaria sordida]|uniref:Uncharacterized protein n=1 Tax=Rotaria sordida TaxID=392033 RepID=A0A819H986_9BILA|nr:unnamed protein product [Rotaria sordida]